MVLLPTSIHSHMRAHAAATAHVSHLIRCDQSHTALCWTPTQWALYPTATPCVLGTSNRQARARAPCLRAQDKYLQLATAARKHTQVLLAGARNGVHDTPPCKASIAKPHYQHFSRILPRYPEQPGKQATSGTTQRVPPAPLVLLYWTQLHTKTCLTTCCLNDA